MSDDQTPTTKSRPAPGERRIQILQTLAQMLQTPGAERVTTALLAKRLDVSEAALYRHFASKAQMFEGLIEFIESSVFGLINQITAREANPAMQCKQIASMVLSFGEKNPGMTRVMVGDALVFEHERLQARMTQFFEKIESSFKQAMRDVYSASSTPTADANVHAAALTALLAGRLQRYARSGFKKLPTENMDATLAFMI
ncbi:MAG: nucleoid occlusion factor SlmA [Cytophagales bacterium]|nr:nucleoid occlusion factor SlmA [Cytophagales bacterium]